MLSNHTVTDIAVETQTLQNKLSQHQARLDAITAQFTTLTNAITSGINGIETCARTGTNEQMKQGIMLIGQTNAQVAKLTDIKTSLDTLAVSVIGETKALENLSTALKSIPTPDKKSSVTEIKSTDLGGLVAELTSAKIQTKSAELTQEAHAKVAEALAAVTARANELQKTIENASKKTAELQKEYLNGIKTGQIKLLQKAQQNALEQQAREKAKADPGKGARVG